MAMAQKSSDQTRAQMSMPQLEEEVTQVLKRKRELEEKVKSASKKIKLDEIFSSDSDSDSDSEEEEHDSDSDREQDRTNKQEDLDEKILCLKHAKRALSKAPLKHVKPALDSVKEEIKKLLTEEKQMHARWATEDKDREDAERASAIKALEEALEAFNSCASWNWTRGTPARDVILENMTKV